MEERMAGQLVKNNDSMLKMLPQSIEAEEAVLGAILVNPLTLGRIIENPKVFINLPIN